MSNRKPETKKSSPKSVPSKKAVVVGINYTGTDNQLSGCINDAHNIKNMLITQYGFSEQNIVMLTDAPGSGKDVLPTKANIIDKINWLVRDAKAGDFLVFTYSGHGDWQRDRNNDESDGKDEDLVPLDFERNGEILDDYLNANLVAKVPNGAKLVCIVDACHSGTVLDLKYNIVPLTKNPSDPRFSYNVENSPLTSGKVICISGCADRETSADTNEEGKATGALTYCLLSSLKNCNYKTNLPSLLIVMRNWMKSNGYTQIPQISFGNMSSIEPVFSFSN